MIDQLTIRQALSAALDTLERCLQEEKDLTQALARFFCADTNPLGLTLKREDRLFLAEHMLSRSQAQSDALRALIQDYEKALGAYLGTEESAMGQMRRARLKSLSLTEAHLPEDVLRTLICSLASGAAPDKRLYGAGHTLKAALAALSYLLLRSGLLPEEADDVHADALIAGVCASVDVASALSAVREKQTTFASTQKLLNCAYLAFLMCACEGAVAPDFASVFSAFATFENELPESAAQEWVKGETLHAALQLAMEHLPLQLKLLQTSPVLAARLHASIVPATAACLGAQRLLKEETEPAPLPRVAAASTWVRDEEKVDPD